MRIEADAPHRPLMPDAAPPLPYGVFFFNPDDSFCHNPVRLYSSPPSGTWATPTAGKRLVPRSDSGPATVGNLPRSPQFSQMKMQLPFLSRSVLIDQDVSPDPRRARPSLGDPRPARYPLVETIVSPWTRGSLFGHRPLLPPWFISVSRTGPRPPTHAAFLAMRVFFTATPLRVLASGGRLVRAGGPPTTPPLWLGPALRNSPHLRDALLSLELALIPRCTTVRRSVPASLPTT